MAIGNAASKDLLGLATGVAMSSFLTNTFNVEDNRIATKEDVHIECPEFDCLRYKDKSLTDVCQAPRSTWLQTVSDILPSTSLGSALCHC